MELGVFHELTIDRFTSVGAFLKNESDEVLLPKKYLNKDNTIGEVLKVFVYLDHEERPVATTLVPLAIKNQFAWLQVSYINEFGAFLDWGLEKDLFVPFREQARPMQEGHRYLIYVYEDKVSKRLVGSSRTSKFLKTDTPNYKMGDEVRVLVAHSTDLGFQVIVDQSYQGMVYKNQIFQKDIKPGVHRAAYVTKVREDGKIDVQFEKPGHEKIDQHAQQILALLKLQNGFLALTDKSSPEEIYDILSMSKKNFKNAIGNLYKQKRIELTSNGITLVGFN